MSRCAQPYCRILLLALLFHAFAFAADQAVSDPVAAAFARQVEPRLSVPEPEQRRYAGLLDAALQDANLAGLPSQYFALVDRDPHVQAILIYRLNAGNAADASVASRRWDFIGASPVSTGKPGRPDYFVTPVGVFTHSLANPDFRAEGTKNKNGIRGYGNKGMRVYDFGWAYAQRGWGAGNTSQMRLQMHATDPDLLERRLGERASKGCVRIPASLNDFLDRYALLDADYERALASGARLWMLRHDRTPVPDPGRYLVVVDSGLNARPAWSPLPSGPPGRAEGKHK